MRYEASRAVCNRCNRMIAEAQSFYCEYCLGSLEDENEDLKKRVDEVELEKKGLQDENEKFLGKLRTMQRALESMKELDNLQTFIP